MFPEFRYPPDETKWLPALSLSRASSGLGIPHRAIQLFFVTMEMMNEELKLRDIEYVTGESIITLNFSI